MWRVLYSWPSQETSVAAEIDEDEESMVPLLEESSRILQERHHGLFFLTDFHSHWCLMQRPKMQNPP